MKKLLILLSLVSSGIVHASAEQELQKAINQVGDPCHKVTQVFRSGSHNGSLMFSVACSGGQTYFIKVDKDGTGKVLSCRVLERLGSRCFEKL